MNRRPLPCVVRNLRPIPPTIELMPGVVLYDHEADPDDVQVSALPGPSTTTVRLHEPDVSYDGSPRHITVIAAEQLSVQFTTPREALTWLAHCNTLVRAAWDQQANDMAGVS